MDDVVVCSQVEGGEEKVVTLDNVGEFVRLSVRAVLYDTVQAQLAALIDGINDVFRAESLGVFSAGELASLLGAAGEQQDDPRWTASAILPHLSAKHGYSARDRQITDFIALLCELTVPQRRLMLRWLTGSPRLPKTGFAGFPSRLTVVAREGRVGVKSDDMLPTVSTCMVRGCQVAVV